MMVLISFKSSSLVIVFGFVCKVRVKIYSAQVSIYGVDELVEASADGVLVAVLLDKLLPYLLLGALPAFGGLHLDAEGVPHILAAFLDARDEEDEV